MNEKLSNSPAWSGVRLGVQTGRLLLIVVFVVLGITAGQILNTEQTSAEDVKDVEPPPPVIVNASVDRTDVTIGEKINFVVSIEYSPGTDVSLPEFGQNLADFTIKDFGVDQEKKLRNGRLRKREWYVLDTFLTGSYVIPALSIRYQDADGGEGETVTDEIFIEVRSVIEDGAVAEDIREIKGPLNVNVSYALIYLILAGVAGAAIAACGVIYFLRRGREKKQDVPPPSLPAHEIAYKELEHLVSLDLISKGQVKEYYYRISNIVRHYIENRFALVAPERTTEEFLLELTAAQGSSVIEHRGVIKRFLEQCDLVKFARYGPETDEIDGVYRAAKRLVDETRQLTVNS